MAAVSDLTRLARIDSPCLRFSPLRSRSLSKPRPFADVQDQSIFLAARVGASFKGGRFDSPYLLTAKFTHFSERLFSLPKAASRSTPTTTEQTSGSEGGSSLRAFQISMPPVFRMVLEIIGFIVRLTGTFFGFLRKEENVMNEIEDDVDKTANFVKVAAKGIEEVAEGLEKVCEVVEKDAKRVDAVMDKVKSDTKAVHDELENAIDTLEGSAKDVQAKAAEGKQVASEVKVKAATLQTETEEVKYKTDVQDSSTSTGNTSPLTGNRVNSATSAITSNLHAKIYSGDNSKFSTSIYTFADRYKQLERMRWWVAMGCRAAVLLWLMMVLVRRMDLMNQLLTRQLFMNLSSSAFALTA